MKQHAGLERGQRIGSGQRGGGHWATSPEFGVGDRGVPGAVSDPGPLGPDQEREVHRQLTERRTPARRAMRSTARTPGRRPPMRAARLQLPLPRRPAVSPPATTKRVTSVPRSQRRPRPIPSIDNGGTPSSNASAARSRRRCRTASIQRRGTWVTSVPRWPCSHRVRWDAGRATGGRQLAADLRRWLKLGGDARRSPGRCRAVCPRRCGRSPAARRAAIARETPCRCRSASTATRAAAARGAGPRF